MPPKVPINTKTIPQEERALVDHSLKILTLSTGITGGLEAMRSTTEPDRTRCIAITLDFRGNKVRLAVEVKNSLDRLLTLKRLRGADAGDIELKPTFWNFSK
jgi:hypothetical protein